MDEWLNYLYVMGALTDEDQMGDPRLKNLVYEYNSMFPENPLSEDFFFDNTTEIIIEKLSDAIINYQPIKSRTR